MTAEEFIHECTDRRIRLTTDGANVTAVGPCIWPGDIELMKKLKPELIVELHARDDELARVFGRYNRALERWKDAESHADDSTIEPSMLNRILDGILAKITQLVEIILAAGYRPTGDELRNGFVIAGDQT